MREEITTFSNEISPWLMTHGLKILVIIAGAYIARMVVIRFVEKIVRISVKPDAHTSLEAEKMREDTLIRIFVWTLNISFLIIVVMMLLQEFGIPIGPILAGAGIVGIAVGFGGQYLIRDIISGFFIILENQYRIGDAVNFDGTSGKVEDITLRITTLRDMDGTVHYIPHGEIKRVSNLSKSFARVNLNIPVAYDSDLGHVIETVNNVGKEMGEDPKWKDILISPIRFLRVQDFSESAIIIKIVGETQPSRQWEVTGELRMRIKEAFDKEGIQMPVQQKIIHQTGSSASDD